MKMVARRTRDPVANGRRPDSQSGFSLIEVLVTMAIIAVAVLGMAGMQAHALRIQKDAGSRAGAIVVVLGLIERMETNNVGAVARNYVQDPLPATVPGVVDCRTATCTSSQLATFDLDEFRKTLDARLPGATARITAAGTGPIVYTIEVTWTERTYAGRGGTLAASSASENDLDGRRAGGVDTGGTTETMRVTMTRRVYDRSVVL